MNINYSILHQPSLRRGFRRGMSLLLLLLSLPTLAQAPKTAKKIKKSVYTVHTYDADGKLLHTGNGFFTAPDGHLITSYALFPGAIRAEVIDSKGKATPIQKVLGANETYDIIKLQTAPVKKLVAAPIDTTLKKIQPKANSQPSILNPQPTSPDKLFLPSIGNEKKIYDEWLTVTHTESVAGDYRYYTLRHTGDTALSHRPLLDATGNVVAIVQPSAETDTLLYALDIRYAADLSVKALSVNDPTYRALSLRKALPTDTAQALVSLFLVAEQADATLRNEVIDEFITSFPQHYEGYLSRAAHRIALKSDSAYALAEADHTLALTYAGNKADEVHTQIARQILPVALDTLTSYKDWTPQRAITEIDKARAINPLPIYIQQQGDIYITLKEYTKAYDKYMEVNHSSIGSPDTWLRTAYIIEQRGAEGDINLAITLMDSAVNKATLNSQPSTLNQAAPYVLERALLKARHDLHRPAVADYNLYEELVGTVNTDRFYYLREQSEAAGRMYQQALDDIKRAITLAPQQPIYLLELATLNIRVGRYTEAVPILELLVTHFPNDADCNRLLGFSYIKSGDTAKGLPYLEKAANMGDAAATELLNSLNK